MSLCAGLLSLAVLEHWFLVVPLPFETLWNWGLRSRAHAPHEALEPKPSS